MCMSKNMFTSCSLICHAVKGQTHNYSCSHKYQMYRKPFLQQYQWKKQVFPAALVSIKTMPGSPVGSTQFPPIVKIRPIQTNLCNF